VQYHAHALQVGGADLSLAQKYIEMDETYFSLKQIKILKFAVKTCFEPNRITDMEFNELRKLGLSDSDFVEVIETATTALSIARLTETLDLVADEWYANIEFDSKKGKIIT
jgi:alkylhydroperoxidase family enzyme